MINAMEPMPLEGIIYFPGKPRQYRADCQAGQFKIGADQMTGKELDLEILAYRTFEDALFGYSKQLWVEVFFVNGANIVSNILFKTESGDNFLSLILDLSVKKVAVGKGITTARMEKRVSRTNGENYYAVAFSWREQRDGERIRELAEFVAENALFSDRFDDSITIGASEVGPELLPESVGESSAALVPVGPALGSPLTNGNGKRVRKSA